jgi:hypothetical protein
MGLVNHQHVVLRQEFEGTETKIESHDVVVGNDDLGDLGLLLGLPVAALVDPLTRGPDAVLGGDVIPPPRALAGEVGTVAIL